MTRLLASPTLASSENSCVSVMNRRGRRFAAAHTECEHTAKATGEIALGVVRASGAMPDRDSGPM